MAGAWQLLLPGEPVTPHIHLTHNEVRRRPIEHAPPASQESIRRGMNEKLKLPSAPNKSITFTTPVTSTEEKMAFSYPKLETEYIKKCLMGIMTSLAVGDEFQVRMALCS